VPLVTRELPICDCKFADLECPFGESTGIEPLAMEGWEWAMPPGHPVVPRLD
jgi:hypothetical protein